MQNAVLKRFAFRCTSLHSYLVEATGVEPVSKHILQKLSTCLLDFGVSGMNWKPTTDSFLSCIVLSNQHSLWLQQPVLFLSRRRGMVTD